MLNLQDPTDQIDLHPQKRYNIEPENDGVLVQMIFLFQRYKNILRFQAPSSSTGGNLRVASRVPHRPANQRHINDGFRNSTKSCGDVRGQVPETWATTDVVSQLLGGWWWCGIPIGDPTGTAGSAGSTYFLNFRGEMIPIWRIDFYFFKWVMGWNHQLAIDKSFIKPSSH